MIVNGTTYHDETPQEVVKILEVFRQSGRSAKIRLYLGDAKTGKDWLEEHDVEGYIGRSTGSVKVPLLLRMKTSSGGGAILDHCIVKIKSGRLTIYKHPLYNAPELKLKRNLGGE